jgi:glycosyltransferase involved in cell wall biosynthesis
VFVDAAGAPVPYTDPWSGDLGDRLRALVARRRRIAYFYERPDSSTFRYRVFNMIQALDAQPHLDVSAAWFTRDDLEISLDFVDRADVLIICRSRYDAMMGRLIARARAHGLLVLYDVDDLVFDLRYAHVIGDTINLSLRSSEEWDCWFAYIGRLGQTLQLCDGAITTNRFLGERITEFAPWIEPRVIPNFLNRMQTVASRAIYRRKLASGFQRNGRVHIGYFSGTSTHSKDFGVAAGALHDLLVKDDKINLRVVGSLDLPKDIACRNAQIRIYPLQDFINLQRLQGEVEIAIAPTQDNVFNNCKSELKYFEAAAVGTVVIASPIFSFRHAILDGENGFLAPPYAWRTTLERALALLDGDASEYRALVGRAVARVEERYGWDRQAKNIVSQVFGD